MAITHLTGHVLDVLKTLPDESVHCCITSPPYWGLRKYDIPDVIFDDPGGCDHEWGETSIITNKSGGYSEKQHSNTGAWNPDGIVSKYGFCLHCNAWHGQLGLEPTPALFIKHIVEVFREVRRMLRKDGTLWLNLGDSYAGVGPHHGDKTKGKSATNRGTETGIDRVNIPGLKPKDLCGIPWMVAFALRDDGWYLRSDIIWSKPNPMPESVTDRPTKAHEYIFLFAKSQKYFWDQEAVREPHTRDWSNESMNWCKKGDWAEQAGRNDANRTNPPKLNPSGRNIRTVWTIATQPYSEAHFATFPEKLIEPMIRAGTSEKGCCPKCGSPWERVLSKREIPFEDTRVPGQHKPTSDKKLSGPKMQKWLDENPVKTLGWQSTCECELESIPCTVLDPFIGSGTVARVATRLRRDCIGIDLGYDELSEKRLKNTQVELL